MKRPLFLAAVFVALVAAIPGAHAQRRIWVAPDVPTDPDLPASYLPWQVVLHRHLDPAPYALELTLPGSPAIDGLEKLDAPGDWLVSFEAPTDLAGALGGAFAQPRDVIRTNPGLGSYSFFFVGSCVGGAVPDGSDVDALYLEGGDAGSLIVSFDVPTTIGPSAFAPGELVRYKSTGPPPCGWALSGSVIDFSTALGSYFPASANVVAADTCGPDWLLALDVPADLGPPGVTTYTPGEIVSTDGVTVALYDDLQAEGAPGWPVSSLVHALTGQANPGTIYDPTLLPVGLLVGKAPAGDITLFWPGGSCSSGGEDYGIYEGTIANVQTGVYDHVRIVCTDAPPLVQETITPAAPSSYYLVVPHNSCAEGSYGKASSGADRPQPAAPADRCVVTQVLSACP